MDWYLTGAAAGLQHCPPKQGAGWSGYGQGKAECSLGHNEGYPLDIQEKVSVGLPRAGAEE